MRQIDLQTWSRHEHFKALGKYDRPHFNICANVDLTHFYPIVRHRGLSFTAAMVYLLTRTTNSNPVFHWPVDFSIQQGFAGYPGINSKAKLRG
jgi:chloramphenicol O-acetyltransferase type A